MNPSQPIDFRVSVVIPTHNRAAELVRAIRSVSAQSIPALEVIVVDDASTDGTDEIDFAELDPRITYIRHDRNRGGAVSRNTGIERSSGDWIAFLDSDDIWLPQKLERQLELRRRRPSDDFFICGNVISRKPDGTDRLFNSRPPAPRENISEYFLVRGFSFQTSALVVPARLLKEMRFNETLRRHQDWDLVLRLLERGIEFEYSQEPVAVYSDSADQSRISRQMDAGPTLHWFDTASRLISPAAAAYLYSYMYFPRHLKSSPVHAVRTMANLGCRDVRAFQHAVQACARRVSEKYRFRDLRRQGSAESCGEN